MEYDPKPTAADLETDAQIAEAVKAGATVRYLDRAGNVVLQSDPAFYARRHQAKVEFPAPAPGSYSGEPLKIVEKVTDETGAVVSEKEVSPQHMAETLEDLCGGEIVKIERVKKPRGLKPPPPIDDEPGIMAAGELPTTSETLPAEAPDDNGPPDNVGAAD